MKSSFCMVIIALLTIARTKCLFVSANFFHFPDEYESWLSPIDNFLNNYVPPMFGLPSRDINGTDEQFREQALEDDLNDDATFMSPVS